MTDRTRQENKSFGSTWAACALFLVAALACREETPTDFDRSEDDSPEIIKIDTTPVPAPAVPEEKPAVRTLSMKQICTGELVPRWGTQKGGLWESLERLRQSCKDPAFCEGPQGFSSHIQRAQKAKAATVACTGCHAAWRAKWSSTHAEARFEVPADPPPEKKKTKKRP